MPLYEIDEAGTRKFYRVVLEGTVVRQAWGRIGTAGQEKVTDHVTVAAANKAYDAECYRRRERGYRLVLDEAVPHDKELVRSHAETQRLTALAPLTEVPRFLFKNTRTKRFVWLEQHDASVVEGGGALGADGALVPLPDAAPATREEGSSDLAKRRLSLRSAALLAEGYVLDAYGAAPAKKKRPVRTGEKAPAAPVAQREAKAWPPTGDPKRPLGGYFLAFFGEFAIWPSYHGGTPRDVAEQKGARVVSALSADTDCVVFGDHRGAGRSVAKKKAESLRAGGAPLHILDEAEYRELVKVDLQGKRFLFVGGFDCSPGGLDDGVLEKMVQGRGGAVQTEMDASVDYLVVGNHQGSGKIATQNKAAKLNEAGASITKLTETGFLELVRIDTVASGGELDFAGFLSQLYGHVNEAKLGRALAMLRTDRHQLFTNMDDTHLVGVVKSQSGSGSVYASWLAPAGRYGCMTSTLDPCMGLQGTVCKHLLVLVVGLARAGELAKPRAIEWIRAANGKAPKDDKELSAETFIKYKGAEAGEIDWRPTETIPEDFYAL